MYTVHHHNNGSERLKMQKIYGFVSCVYGCTERKEHPGQNVIVKEQRLKAKKHITKNNVQNVIKYTGVTTNICVTN
jgi:hypothetical protein